MKTLYQCEVCKELYKTEEKALACERQKFMPRLEVGDIVLARSGFGWFDGDQKWIQNFHKLGMYTNPGEMPGKENHGNCFRECCTYVFFYVVTAIDHDTRDPHRVRYHLATKAMSASTGYLDGYTFDEGHYRPRKVRKPPEFIVEDSKDLIGLESDSLL
jgi:hypothetical protein